MISERILFRALNYYLNILDYSRLSNKKINMENLPTIYVVQKITKCYL